MNTAVEELKLDFHGIDGLFYKKMRGAYRGVNSEAYKSEEDGVGPTDRRWIQFLDSSEKITENFIDDNGGVRISDLAADKYGYTINPCGEPLKVLHEILRSPKYWSVLANAPRDNESMQLDGFSIPEERKIYFKEGIYENQKNFVIAHELSHFLLGHKGKIFYKTSRMTDDVEKETKKKLYEREEYNEEADKLAAILLMPYLFMYKYSKEGKSDSELSVIFNVPIRAVEKRRKEFKREVDVFCYTPASRRIQV